MGKQETLETIWEVPDELWERIEPIILEEDPPKARGRKRSDPRQMLNGIIFRLRSGCQWNRLPKELGDDSTIHRTFQRWVGTGVLHRMWDYTTAYGHTVGNHATKKANSTARGQPSEVRGAECRGLHFPLRVELGRLCQRGRRRPPPSQDRPPFLPLDRALAFPVACLYRRSLGPTNRHSIRGEV